MKGMIETIARTLARREGQIAGESSDFADWHWEEFIDHARDVLSAMREPTEAMHAAEVACYNEITKQKITRVGPALWEAMIDAALGEETPGGQR